MLCHAEERHPPSSAIDGLLTATDLFNLQAANVWLLIDLRSAEEYEASHLVHAWNLPIDAGSSSRSLVTAILSLLARVDEECPPDDRRVAILQCPLHCPSSLAETVAQALKAHGADQEESSYLSYRSVKKLHHAAWRDVCATMPFLTTTLLPTDARLHVPFYPSMVLPHLFISGAVPAQDLKAVTDLGITHIVNLSARSNAFDGQAGFVYHRCKIFDAVEQDLGPTLASSLAFIEAAHGQGRKVLVHCDHGQSRSASVVLAYLIQQSCRDLSSSPLSVDEAVVTLRQHHPRAQPNEGFMAQLLAFQERLVSAREEAQQAEGKMAESEA